MRFIGLTRLELTEALPLRPLRGEKGALLAWPSVALPRARRSVSNARVRFVASGR